MMRRGDTGKRGKGQKGKWIIKEGSNMNGGKNVCPHCGGGNLRYRNPIPTVDIIIEVGSEIEKKGLILISRKNEPKGWALPGGFVDYGESLEQAAVREAKEETDLDVELVSQFHTYSDPQRDPRRHTISTVFIARGKGVPRAGDDAGGIGIFTEKNLPKPLAFDHERIVREYFAARRK